MQQQQGIFKSSKKALEAVLNEAKGRIGRRQKRVVPLRQPKTKQPLSSQPVQNISVQTLWKKFTPPSVMSG